MSVKSHGSQSSKKMGKVTSDFASSFKTVKRDSSAGKMSVKATKSSISHQVFAIHDIQDTEEVRVKIKAGFPSTAFGVLTREMQISKKKLKEVVGISAQTLHRREEKKERFHPDESERLFRIGRLFQLAIELTGSNEKAHQWFTTPKHALNGKTPLDYSDTEPGAREVEDLIGRLEHGVF